ncbi:PAS domain S-box protein [Rhodocytophaga aerolata]|uniref:histidine kinase n=1 Tax=Rhodocytophaga aerolata TaxID=455078 RepID=A0ABT8RB57_9BACT|nr:PAS domain S-box protein [Rhodocytophaga aerolata]MDO1449295.1 PAS domain S-box protein [Rhodocytophaga aerolata]
MKNINEPQGEEHKSHFLSGGGKLAELIRAFDWDKTSLGSCQQWPQSLKTAVSIVLRSPVPLVMLWGSEGVMIYNDAYAVFAGARHPFLLGSKVVEGWPEVADFNRHVMQNGLEGKTLSYKDQPFTLYRNNEAEQVWMDLNYSPVIDERGNPAGVLAIVVETTKRVLAERKQKQAEQALGKREEHLRTLITASSDLIFTMSADWSEMGVLQGNVFIPDTGKPQRDWFEKNIPPTDQLPVRHAINQAIKHKSIFQLEHRIRLADRTIGWTVSRAIPILNSEGSLVEWLGSASNVTERKRMEEALKESEARFRAIADDAPVFLFLARENAEVEYLNKTWRDYTGVAMEDSKGRAWAEITHADDIEPATNIYMEGFTKRASCTFENRQKGTDGIYRTILWKATPRFSPNGQFIGMMGVGLDIDDRKNAEQRLKESETRFRSLAEEFESKNRQLIRINNDLDNFIYTASHDLKAPITNIEGLIQNLWRTLPADLVAMQRVGRIRSLLQDSVERFKRTIDSLTEVVKLQKENSKEAVLVDLAQVIGEVLLDLEPLMVATNAQVSIDVKACPPIRFSEKNLRSVVYNLLSNAIKYRSPERVPLVHIGCECTSRGQVLRVSDNGLGIQPRRLDQLFTMFRRFHDHVEGSGIGLYMIKKMVENAGGEITVESQVGKGSTFRVYFLC